MIEVPINPNVLRWARERAGLDVEQVAKNFVDSAKIDQWEQEGTSVFPTLAQAEALATKLRIPLPVLLLDEHPSVELPIPDLRTIDGGTPPHPSPEFVETVNDTVVRQSWYREHVIAGGGHPLPFVGQFTGKDNPVLIARSIRNALQLDEKLRLLSRSWQDFLSKFIQRVDGLGIVVMRNSVVRNDNTRKLQIDEFRGFAISEPYAPLIFINSRDAKAAQIFTLAHELAHVWVGATGISNPDPRRKRDDINLDLEKTCNAIAAEVLVPRDSFARAWTSSRSTDANLKHVATYFRVSSIVALRRANELGKITFDDFLKRVKAEYARFRAQDEKEQQKEERSGNFWNLFTMRNSQRFTDAVTGAARAGNISYIYGGKLLGVKAATLENYIRKFHG